MPPVTSSSAASSRNLVSLGARHTPLNSSRSSCFFQNGTNLQACAPADFLFRGCDLMIPGRFRMQPSPDPLLTSSGRRKRNSALCNLTFRTRLSLFRLDHLAAPQSHVFPSGTSACLRDRGFRAFCVMKHGGPYPAPWKKEFVGSIDMSCVLESLPRGSPTLNGGSDCCQGEDLYACHIRRSHVLWPPQFSLGVDCTASLSQGILLSSYLQTGGHNLELIQ
jgi:hypothetical protein